MVWHLAKRTKKDLKEHLLERRGFSESDLNPPSPLLLLPHLLPLLPDLKKATSLINQTIKKTLPIIIHGDYDCDGLCATAILWETIYRHLDYQKVIPFIPSRFDHGYGLSDKSLQALLKNLKEPKGALLITVDCGIGAINQVSAAKKLGLNVILTDHHQPLENPKVSTDKKLRPDSLEPIAKMQKEGLLPQADAIIWTDKLCGTGIAWVISAAINNQQSTISYLDLAAIATICDVQPLTGFNRVLVHHGLVHLNKISISKPTLKVGEKNVGLEALIKVGKLEGKKIGPWEVGWVLGPRLNATGRIEEALDTLRLLATRNHKEASALAEKLNRINLERQQMTEEMLEQAKRLLIKKSNLSGAKHLGGATPYKPKIGGRSSEVGFLPKILVVASPHFHEGLVGLVAGRLVQEFYRPAIVIAQGKNIAKGSARSVPDVDIVACLRKFERLTLSLGGHPGAAGFSLRPEMIPKLTQKLIAYGEKKIKKELLEQKLDIDAALSFNEITKDLLSFLKQLEPYGVGNPRPKFLTKNLEILEFKFMGAAGNHLKFTLKPQAFSHKLSANKTAIWFNYPPELKNAFGVGKTIDLVYTIEKNQFNGKKDIQLMVKDLRLKS